MKFEPRKTDENQGDIVKALRRAGVSVSSTHTVGWGFPDIACGARGLTLTGNFDRAEVVRRLEGVEGLVIHQGANLLLEVKNPHAKQQWRMTKHEKRWHRLWRGQKAVVETALDALKLFGKI